MIRTRCRDLYSGHLDGREPHVEAADMTQRPAECWALTHETSLPDGTPGTA